MSSSNESTSNESLDMKSDFLMSHSKSNHLSKHLSTHANIGSLLSHRYEKLLHAEKYTDCCFLIGNNELKCHKIILAAASPVFEAMFFGPMCELQPNIDILDISLDNFKILISYIYSGKVDFEQLNLEDSIELYYAAEKYLLNELIAECLYAITQKLRFSNILPALELSFCMNLSSLMEICMTFFTRCCLSDVQFINYLKKNYCHIPKDCLKQIVAANKELELPNLLWFVYEWCHQECRELGVKENSDCLRLLKDLQLPENLEICEETILNHEQHQQQQQHQVQQILQREKHLIIERSYYKASRPITIGWLSNEMKIQIKCDRFISLTGVLLHSRLTPCSLPFWQVPNDYDENLFIEIKSLQNENIERNVNQEQNEERIPAEQEREEDYVWRYHVSKQVTKYNSNLLIKWPEGLILSPDVSYEMKIVWQADAYGAEYPCSLMSSKVEGVEFNDLPQTGVSILKGLRLINLI